MRICDVEGCQKKHKAKGYCMMHYERFKKYNDPLGGPLFRIKNKGEKCSVENCERVARSRGMCDMHWKRNFKHGDPNIVKNRYGYYKDWQISKNGYVLKWEPEDPNACPNGYLYQHRFIMSQKLGRPLLKNESVHHKNGNRQDNSIENLELWKVGQPAGQRIVDRVKNAIEIIANEYADALKFDDGLRNYFEKLIGGILQNG